MQDFASIGKQTWLKKRPKFGVKREKWTILKAKMANLVDEMDNFKVKNG